MFEVIDRPVLNPGEWAETARKNDEDLRRLQQFLIKSLSDVSEYMKRSHQTLADIQAGKIRRVIRINQLDTGLVVDYNKSQNLTIFYKGKTKELEKASQEWCVVEALAEASMLGDRYKLDTEYLQGLLEDQLGFTDTDTKTISNIKTRINRYFGEQIIDSDGKGKFWLNRNLLEKRPTF